MKEFISRRRFLKTMGAATVVATTAALGAQSASACLPYRDVWNGNARANNPIDILYTNDVHTYIANQEPKMTYERIAALKQSLADEGKNVLLVDAGDHVQGTAYGAMDKGETIIHLMNAAGYDVAVPGNHEFDYGMTRALEIFGEAEYPYLSCNFINLKTGSPVLEKSKTFEINGVRIAFVGVMTPETLSKAAPSYFMDEGQTEFIYDVEGGANGEKLYQDVQKAIDEAGFWADYVVGIGHLGVDESSSPYTSKEVIANTSGFDAFIDGHSHTKMEREEVLDKSGHTVILTQTGCYLNAIGHMVISAEGISTELVNEFASMDAGIAAVSREWIAAVDDMLGEVIGYSNETFYIMDPVTPDKRIIRSQETNLGDLVADGMYAYFNEIEQLDCDIAIANGGGIRTNVVPGEWSYKTCKAVNPFGNVACLMEITGQQILDMLEFGSRFAGSGKENGGFMHVAGATYEVNTHVENTVQENESKIFLAGPTGEYRVRNVRIYDRKAKQYLPLDVDKTYRIGGINYILRSLGDGFNMFDGAKLIKDYVSEDYLILSTYVMCMEGDIAEGKGLLKDYTNYKMDYKNPYGSGRITLL